MRERVILDLCGGTGSWSRPYAEAGYDVRVLTLPQVDVRHVPHVKGVHGILAAPPCTCFAASGARWPRTERDMFDALSVVDACLRIVFACQPKWWALENPVGKLSRYLGPPALRFDPCDFGDPWTKRTLLWGHFTAPRKTPVPPEAGSMMHTDVRDPIQRAATPPGFARAFFEANP
jgi:hypothetical protein